MDVQSSLKILCFELLSSGASNKKVVLITPPSSGYTVPFLRESSGISQALIYVRSIQKSLETDPAPLFQVLYMHFNYFMQDYMYIQGDLPGGGGAGAAGQSVLSLRQNEIQ